MQEKWSPISLTSALSVRLPFTWIPRMTLTESTSETSKYPSMGSSSSLPQWHLDLRGQPGEYFKEAKTRRHVYVYDYLSQSLTHLRRYLNRYILSVGSKTRHWSNLRGLKTSLDAWLDTSAWNAKASTISLPKQLQHSRYTTVDKALGWNKCVYSSCTL